jgi:hypothetical protein
MEGKAVGSSHENLRGYVARVFPALLSLLATLGCSTEGASTDVPATREAVAVDVAEDLDAAVELASHEVNCPTFAEGVQVGVLEDEDLREASGLAASRRNPGVWWTHNDSGGLPKVYAISGEGRALGTFRLAGIALAWDWEDLAADDTWLYVGDIGDGAAGRAHVTVIRVREPDLDDDRLPVEATLDDVEVRALAYPDEPHNAETLLADPLTGDLFLVTKAKDGHSGVYRAATPFGEPAGDTPQVMERVANLDFGSATLPGGLLATGGDVSPAGDAVLVLTYESALWWRRPVDRPLQAAFAGPACLVPLARATGHEAIAFDADGRGYRSVPEGQHAPVFHYRGGP